MADLESIQKKILSFRNERDWAQFHDPNNLAETLSEVVPLKVRIPARKGKSNGN